MKFKDKQGIYHDTKIGAHAANVQNKLLSMDNPIVSATVRMGNRLIGMTENMMDQMMDFPDQMPDEDENVIPAEQYTVHDDVSEDEAVGSAAPISDTVNVIQVPPQESKEIPLSEVDPTATAEPAMAEPTMEPDIIPGEEALVQDGTNSESDVSAITGLAYQRVVVDYNSGHLSLLDGHMNILKFVPIDTVTFSAELEQFLVSYFSTHPQANG